MQYYNLSSVGWFLDSNGNLTARDTAGNTLAQFVSGFYSSKLNRAFSGVSANNASGTVEGSIGVGTNITAKVTASVLIVATADMANNTGLDQGFLEVYRSAVGIPSVNAAIPGTDVRVGSVLIVNNANTAAFRVTMTIVLLDTGLILNQKTYYYLAGIPQGGGTWSSNQNQSVLLMEM